MTRKSRRLALIAVALTIFGSAIGIVLYGLRGNIVLFLGPSEISKTNPAPGTRLRVGGLVKDGSVVRLTSNTARFTVTDLSTDISVDYAGTEPLPELFREGQGVIAEGILETATLFHADRVLAKHDETYMPRDVADALKKEGKWKGQTAKP